MNSKKKSPHKNRKAPLMKPSTPTPTDSSWVKHPQARLLLGISAAALAAVLWTDSALASEQALKESLDKVTTLTTGAVAKTGLTVTTIIGTIAAAAKHSVGLAAIVMGMGVALSYYLTYLKAWGT
jgi:drug/metabolite transporter (DMT)-like permease